MWPREEFEVNYLTLTNFFTLIKLLELLVAPIYQNGFLSTMISLNVNSTLNVVRSESGWRLGSGHGPRAVFEVNVNVNVNICNALEFPKEQKCGYLLWSIEAKMVHMCFELRSE